MKKETAGDVIVDHLTKPKAGKKKAKGGKKLRKMTIEPAHGGHLVHHEYQHSAEEAMQPSDPEEGMPHVMPDLKSLHAHIDEHLGEPEGEPEAGKE